MVDVTERETQEGLQANSPTLDEGSNADFELPRAIESDTVPMDAPLTAPPLVLLLGSAALALVFGMIGACLALNLFENSSQAAVSNRPVEATARAEADHRAVAFRNQLTVLGRRVEGLKEKVDALPSSNTPPPELVTLQSQMMTLNRTAGEVSALPKHVERVDSRLEEVTREVELLHRKLLLLQSKLGKSDPLTTPAVLPVLEVPPSSDAATAPATDATSSDEAPVELGVSAPEQTPAQDDSDWQRAVALFTKRKYREAIEAFDRLGRSRPEDARVWYYLALSQGFATNHWTDDAQRLVEKGIACERAGNPKVAEIDETFRDLTLHTGKDWLNAYRARAKTQ